MKKLMRSIFGKSIHQISNSPDEFKHGSFKLVIPKSLRDQKQLEQDAYLLDSREVSRVQQKFNYPVGKLNVKSGTELAIRMAARVAKDLSKRSSPSDSIEANAYANAWHFTIWTELCTILPIRHLVKHIIEEANERPILLPINPDRTDCMCWWGQNQLEPFVLSYELTKRNQEVLLFVPWNHYRRFKKRDRLMVSFYASPAFWEPPGSIRIPNRASKSGICPDHMRNSAFIQQNVDTKLVLGDSLDPRPYDELLVRDRRYYPDPVRLTFVKDEMSNRFVTLCPETPVPDLRDGFLRLMGPMTKSCWLSAKKAVAETGLKELHIADLVMFDTALLAHAVVQAGGSVTIWPHSTNAIILPYHQKLKVKQINAITKTSVSRWQNTLNNTNVRLVSQIMLNRPKIVRSFEEDQSICIVFFAGAAKCGRMPAVDFNQHEESMFELFRELNTLPANYRLFVKAKHIWETPEWLSKFFPKKNRFEITDQTTARLSFSNMIYLTTSLGSSALLEGICNGVPSFVVRNMPVTDYTPLTESRGQVGDVQYVMKQLRKCSQKDHYTNVALQNIEWIKSEVDFPNLAN